MKSPKSLRKVLRLHFVAVAILPIMLLGIFGLHYVRHKHLETISSLVDAHALNVTAEAAGFLDDASSALSLIAAMADIEDFRYEEARVVGPGLSGWLKAIQSRFRSTPKALPRQLYSAPSGL